MRPPSVKFLCWGVVKNPKREEEEKKKGKEEGNNKKN